MGTVTCTAAGITITVIAGNPGNREVERPGLIARPFSFVLCRRLAESGMRPYRRHDKMSGEA
jgi:hypothetical protein